MRCSAFSSLCIREEVLCSVHKVDRQDNVTSDLNLIFSHGRALHNILQNEVLANLDDVLYGKWKCLGCAEMHGGDEGKPILESIIPKPHKCGHCGSTHFLYEELSLFSEKHRLTGHPDGFLKLSEYEGFGILEAKSISSQGAWEVKRTPKMDHVIQAMMYMWFTGTKWSQIFYWDKGTNGRSGLIEHHVEYDEDVIEGILSSIDQLWAAVKQVDAAEPVTLPERICADASCPRAGVCSVSKQCFEANA